MDPDIEKHYQELLKEWKQDEDNIKDKIDKMEGKIEFFDKFNIPVTGASFNTKKREKRNTNFSCSYHWRMKPFFPICPQMSYKRLSVR